jgi:hypothetical protein
MPPDIMVSGRISVAQMSLPAACPNDPARPRLQRIKGTMSSGMPASIGYLRF